MSMTRGGCSPDGKATLIGEVQLTPLMSASGLMGDRCDETAMAKQSCSSAIRVYLPAPPK